jgi:hypothetical protein
MAIEALDRSRINSIAEPAETNTQATAITITITTVMIAPQFMSDSEM